MLSGNDECRIENAELSTVSPAANAKLKAKHDYNVIFS